MQRCPSCGGGKLKIIATSRFTTLCRNLSPFSRAIVAIDGSLVLGGQHPRPQRHCWQSEEAK